MDKKLLNELMIGGAEITRRGKKATDVEKLAAALKSQGTALVNIMEKLATMNVEPPIVNVEPPTVNVDVKERKQQSTPVSVNVPSRAPLKSLQCRITGRDVEGNMTSFEVVPIYEQTH